MPLFQCPGLLGRFLELGLQIAAVGRPQTRITSRTARVRGRHFFVLLGFRLVTHGLLGKVVGDTLVVSRS